MDDIVRNGIQISEGRLFSVRKYVFSGWFLSVLLHSGILLILLFNLTGQVGLLSVGENSQFRQVGIMLLPADKPVQKNVKDNGLQKQKSEKKNDPDQKEKPPVESSLAAVQKNEENKPEPHPQISKEKQIQPVKETPTEKSVSESNVVVNVADSGKKNSSQSRDNNPLNTGEEEHSESDIGALQKNETIFFGLKDKGVRFVYLIDVSASMEGIAIERVKKEMVASLKHLKADQFFQILFFNRKTYTVKIRRKQINGMFRASKMNQKSAETIIKKIQTDGGTQYYSAIRKALELNPDVIYLLSDAGLPGLSAGDLNALKELNRGASRIHTVEFGKDPEIKKANNFLRRLSTQNNGQYRYYHVRN
jgi:von Willebrand factor type A domain